MKKLCITQPTITDTSTAHHVIPQGHTARIAAWVKNIVNVQKPIDDNTLQRSGTYIRIFESMYNEIVNTIGTSISITML